MRRSHLLRLTGPTSRQRMLLLPVVLLLFLAGGAAPAAAEVLRDETVERYALAPGGRVEITNVNGNLEFSSWERDEVLLETTKVVKALGHGRAARALEDLRIEVEHTPELLEVRTRPPRGSDGVSAWLTGGHVQARVTYRVTLPLGVSLAAKTVNGDVFLDAVSGTVTTATTNGQIHIVEGAGEAKASTTNGNIRAEFVELARGGNVELRTTNGGIAVFVPATTAADLDASTVNGAVTTDFAVLVDGSTAWRRKSLRGAINGGGGRITLETVNGSIQLRIRDGG